MIEQGSIISYLRMCGEENVNLQRGMNFRLKGSASIILMNVHKGAVYNDRIEENGNILIYEGHDIPNKKGGFNPKEVDQQIYTDTGKLTQNGLFLKAVQEFKKGKQSAEMVKVYEKIRPGIWVFNGLFKLIDAWQEEDLKRQVFKFKLEITDSPNLNGNEVKHDIEHNRIIPTSVKLEVWRRDKGQCVLCGSKDNLHFDHDIPFSLGGSSITAKNIRLLCARHNLEKHNKIM
jgi:hypothetical protein